MNKRTVILCCIVTVFLFLLGASAFLLKQKYDFRQTIAVLPDFCLPQAVDSMLFCNTQIAQDRPVVLLYFHPECDFCRNEIQQIQQKMDNSGGIQLILISNAGKYGLRQFAATYQLDIVPDLTILMDQQLEMYDRLQVKSIPSCYIYDRRHQLVAVKQGAMKLEILIRLANQ